MSRVPERTGSLGGDLFAMGVQVAIVVGLPLLLAATIGSALDRSLGTTPWGLLTLVFVGLGVAGVGVFAIIRRYLALTPVRPPSEEARAAGRLWRQEIEERERRREAGGED